MEVMWGFQLLLALAGSVAGSSAATHWMVTENGFIQPRENSPYDMARPYDLVGFLNQEKAQSDIIQIYHNLVQRQEDVSKQWLALQQSTDINMMFDFDSDCMNAGQINNINLYTAVLDRIRHGVVTDKDFNFYNYVNNKGRNDEPDCEKFSDLPFSMTTFEHLEEMVNRKNLSMDPDRYLQRHIFPSLDDSKLGNQITDYLMENKTSWLHYALASVYWKAQGNALKSLECSRRAVFYAPRMYKDIALLSMGTVFLRCGKKHETHVILSAAVDHGPEHAVNHFALGNSHVMLGELNSSIACYNRSLKIDPTFYHANRVRHLMLCHQKILTQLDQVQNCLNSLKANLSEYGALEFKWWKQQALFLHATKSQSHLFHDLTRTSMDAICETMDEMLGLDFCSLKRKGDKSSLIEVLLESSEFPENLHDPVPLVPLNAVFTMQTFVNNIEKQMDQIQSLVSKSEHLRAKDGKIRSESEYKRELDNVMPPLQKHSTISKSIDPVMESVKIASEDEVESDKDGKDEITSTKSVADLLEFEGGPVLYPATFKVNRNREDFDTSDEWPPRELCAEWAPRFPLGLRTVYPVFLPFENKGLRLGTLLSEKIGLTLQEEHPLPWHPPVCQEVKGSTRATLPRLPKSQTKGESVSVEHLRSWLLKYVSNGDTDAVENMHEAEIGQRILTTYNKKAAPAWIVYTLSSLYWRVRRNNAKALTCLASASKLAPVQYLDIVHTSLASVLLEVGYVEEALAFASQAFRTSLYEPASNFLLSLIHMSKNNRMAQIFHMRQVVRVEPDYMGGLARALLYAWECKHVTTATTTDREAEAQVCYDSEHSRTSQQKVPTKAYIADSDSCLRSSLQNLKHHLYTLDDEISTIVRLLDLGPSRHGELGESGELEGGERRDAARKLRYTVLDNMLQNCGEEDCSKLYAVKATDIHAQSCFFQHLRFWYWLPYLRLENLLQERGLRIEKLRLDRSLLYLFPDCKMPRLNGDPILAWLSLLDMENWHPLPDLITELVALLGKKDKLEEISAALAHHVLQSTSWVELLLAALWCGGFARGSCCIRCIASAIYYAPQRHKDIPLLSLVSVLHLQNRPGEAKQAAYFALTFAPKNKLHLFVAGISHTYVGEYSDAIRMLRLSLTREPQYAVARACLQATMCLVLYADDLAEAL